MSVVIEKEFGRAAKYNARSSTPVAMWSQSLVDAIQRTGGHGGPPLQL